MPTRAATKTTGPCHAPKDTSFGGRFHYIRALLRVLYHGKSASAQRFQLTVISIDLLTIVFFVLTPLIKTTAWFSWSGYAIAALLGLDTIARGLASKNVKRWLRQPAVLIDLFIFCTLLFPYHLANFGFLRILRLWSVSQSGMLWLPLRRHGLQRWETVGRSLASLITFLFVATGFIYTFFFRASSGIDGYIDALYFTVATITTTGFGDITLPGPWGKLTSIVTMLTGISLFVRLAQALFRPYKIDFECPRCALMRHEPDAVHCKACGLLLQIPDDDNVG